MTGVPLLEPTNDRVQRYLLREVAPAICAPAEPLMCEHGVYLDGACAECREERTGVPERDHEYTESSAVKLSQVAPWNPQLRNPYRTRWAEAGGRYFKVEAEYLDSPWWVTEVDRDGEDIYIMGEGETRSQQIIAGGTKFTDIALRLADAREIIAAEVDGREPNLPGARRRRS